MHTRALSFLSVKSVKSSVSSKHLFSLTKRGRCGSHHGAILVINGEFSSLSSWSNWMEKNIYTLSPLFELQLSFSCSLSLSCLFCLEAEKRNEPVLCFVITHKSSGGWSNKFHFIGRRWSLFLFKLFSYSFMPRCWAHLGDQKEFPDVKVHRQIPGELNSAQRGCNLCRCFQL